MTDERMTELFWERSESALEEVQKHYAPSLYSLAMRLLNSPEDAEEIVNDTLLAAWNSIPPNRPESLKAYLSAVCRRRAMDRLDLLRRYWYMLSVEETAGSCGISPGYAKVLLHRLRKKLKAQLEKEEQHE